MKSTSTLAIALLALGSTSCVIIDVDSDTGHTMPGLQASGLIDGHVAFGMSDEEGILDASILDGPSHGGIAHFRIGNLLGLELGVVGAAFNVGPLHVGLGTLFYSPHFPHSSAPAKASDDGEE